MELATLRRRVKRQFGDEYGVIFNDQDIIDWCNSAQTDIVRDAQANDVSISIPANQFPYSPVDRVAFKRVAINNRPIRETTLAELDQVQTDTTVTGQPYYWYYEGTKLNLYPAPAVGDVYNVLVTYTKLPTELHYLEPYFQFISNTIGGSIQYAQTPADASFRKANLNFTIDFVVQNNTVPFTMVACGTDAATAATLSWALYYMGSNDFRLVTSNNAALVTRNLTLSGAFISSGDRIKLRFKYNSATGTFSIDRVDLVTGVETPSGSVVGTVATLNTTTSFPITFNTVGTIAPTIGPQPWKMYGFEYTDSQVSAVFHPYVTVDGVDDIQDLPTKNVVQFESLSGHTWTLNGNPEILVLSTADLTVPDLYHEDVLAYCLAKAFDKNMNYKAADANMEKFQQGVTTRRNEADATDNPSYKSGDPFDFDMDVSGSYYN